MFYNKFAVRNLASQAIVLTLCKSLNLLISLGTAMMLSRYFNLTDYGTYSEIITTIMLSVSIFSAGLPSALSYFIPKATNSRDRKNFITTYYYMVTFLSVIMAIVLIIFVPTIARYYNNQCIQLFTYAFIFLPWANLLMNSRSNMLISVNMIAKQAIYDTTHAITVSLVVIFTIYLNKSFTFFMHMYLAVEILFALTVYYNAYALIDNWKFSCDFHLLKPVVTFSLPIGFATAIGTILLHVDKIMIGGFYDTDAVAIYSNAGRELPLAYIAVCFNTVLMPQIVKMIQHNKITAALVLWKTSMEFCYIIICFLVTSVFVFAPQSISFLYSDKYLPGVDIFRIYTLSVLFRFTYFGMLLNATGNTIFVLVNSFVVLIFNIIFNYVFHHIWGFAGPALASVFSIAVMCICQVYATRYCTSISIRNMFPWRELFYISIQNCIMGLIVYYTFNVIIPLGTSIQEIIKTVIICMLWGSIYFFFNKDKIKQLWSNLKTQ